MTKHGLRAGYRQVLPGIYLRKGVAFTPFRKARALWLWGVRTHGNGRIILAGMSAAAMWGAEWIRDDDPAECIVSGHCRLRAYPWVGVWRDTVSADDLRHRHGMAVTSPVRTGYDVGRRLEPDRAVEMLDALYRTGRLGKHELAWYTERHPKTRNVRRLRDAIVLSDEGGESPWETRLRLIFIRAGFPRPDTQVDIFARGSASADVSTGNCAGPGGAAGNGAAGNCAGPGGGPGPFIGRVDLAWACWGVLVDYEGKHHNEDGQVSKDVKRGNRFADAGWSWTRVREDQMSGDLLLEVLLRVRRGLIAGGAPAHVLPSVRGLERFVADMPADAAADAR